MESHKENICEYCSKDFSQVSHLYRHIRNVHKIKMFKRNPPETFYKSKYKCNECLQTYVCRSSLSRHRATSHPDSVKRSRPSKKSNPEVQKVNQSDVDAIINTFPDEYKYRIIQHKYGETYDQFFMEFEFFITDVLEASKWKKTFEEKNKIFFLCGYVRNYWKTESVIYKKKFKCGHNMRTASGSNLERQTNCPFHLLISVKKEDTRLITRIRIKGKHNHNIGCASSVKFRPVSEEVKEKFLSLFNYGYTPAKALQSHEKDLKDEHGENFCQIQGDRFHCPNINWVYRLHESVFKKNLASNVSEFI